MQAETLRKWGIGVGGALMAGLGLFVLADERARASRAPVQAETPATQPAAPISFLVRFDASHPLAEAQTMAANGDLDEARRLAERLIRRDRALGGLCFERFTLGGAEIVLTACSPAPAEDPEELTRTWREKFESMPGVTYAESNLILGADARGPDSAQP